jgi:hypothetical protein
MANDQMTDDQIRTLQLVATKNRVSVTPDLNLDEFSMFYSEENVTIRGQQNSCCFLDGENQ